MAGRKINVGIIGTGWIGEIRAKVCANHPLVESVHIAEIDPAKLARVGEETRAKTATTDYRELLRRDDIDAMFVCSTPETTHYPITKDCLLARKHTLLEKPMGLELKEADEMMALAKKAGLKFTIGYTQRFNPKYAYLKKCLTDGTLGTPVTALVSRNVSRSIGNKIGGRIQLSPAVMEATHDIDFILWCLEGIKPVRVYSESVYRIMEKTHGVPDCQWIMVTMEDGIVFTIGAGWALPPGYPHFSTAMIEFVGTEGALLIDDSHRDISVQHDERRNGSPALHDAGRASGTRLPRADGSGDHLLYRGGRPRPSRAGDARAGAASDGNHAGRRSFRRAPSTCQSPAGKLKMED